MSTLQSTLFAALLVIVSTAPPSPGPQMPAGSWGVTVRMDEVFYKVGSEAWTSWELFNGTGQDAFGFSPVRGGNGCEFAVQVRDLIGNVLWQPGSIVGGQFVGPGCLFGSLDVLLPSGSAITQRTKVPLIYQNAGGFGTLGAPLPPGAYVLWVAVTFMGPNHSQGLPPGPAGSYSVQVPFKIEP